MRYSREGQTKAEMTDLALTLPEVLFERIAQRAAELLRDSQPGSPWLTRPQAAEYLGVSLSWLEKDRTLPAHRWAGRVLYNRHELDRALLDA